LQLPCCWRGSRCWAWGCKRRGRSSLGYPRDGRRSSRHPSGYATHDQPYARRSVGALACYLDSPRLRPVNEEGDSSSGATTPACELNVREHPCPRYLLNRPSLEMRRIKQQSYPRNPQAALGVDHTGVSCVASFARRGERFGPGCSFIRPEPA
jgi:hypothetical protein